MPMEGSEVANLPDFKRPSAAHDKKPANTVILKIQTSDPSVKLKTWITGQDYKNI